MSKEIFINPNSKQLQNGQLLLEILVAISAAAIIITLCVNFVALSLRSSKSANEKNVSLGLIDETFEALNAASAESWSNIYTLTHAITDYHPAQSAGKWTISTSGTDSQTFNGSTYVRGFRVYFVCRNLSTLAITGLTDSAGGSEAGCTGSGGTADPSTQKVVVTISFNGNTVTADKYFSGRFANRACNQTSWSSGADSGVYSCASGGTPASSYFAKCNIDVATSTQLKLGGTCP